MAAWLISGLAGREVVRARGEAGCHGQAVEEPPQSEGLRRSDGWRFGVSAVDRGISGTSPAADTGSAPKIGGACGFRWHAFESANPRPRASQGWSPQ